MIDNGATPLLVASQRGRADVTQLLCRVRADIDKEVNDGATYIKKSSTSKLWEFLLCGICLSVSFWCAGILIWPGTL